MSKYNYLIGLFALALILLLNACRRESERGECGMIACDLAMPLITLDLIDGQGRDLLDPATPAHLDSAKIVQLNTGKVHLLGRHIFYPNGHRRKLIIPWPSGTSDKFYLKLSDTDQDTITYSREVGKGCCPSYRLTAFRYNNTTYTDSVSRGYFTVIK
ncbi:hypothetical protein [Mucilaginibacter myungsuensis]|uniref:Uncharacterized protein n=1 Tax=Mucilaginibacter myungsuensis TaxID=649104 RepID=A0A929L7C1_9SPHI|nr:hypothetical protein [Mucilaginibacter myungsuensis]MBE9664516.1 hypothetical protein [Mucilaginibacter myungsuensis]MDN3601339.1 hypothetical protein [Mucilaginibacter myungsuensis]